MMEVEKKVNVAFMTTLEREMFPVKVPQNRFGNDLNPIRGAPHRGPGCYDNEEVSNFKYLSDHKVQSQKGYVLGARTAQRFREKFQTTPAPTKYQTKCTDPKLFEKAFKPFSAASARFPVFKRDLEVGPGAGTYEHSVLQNRKVQWHQSFGGEPINLPEVKIQSTIHRNTDKLLSTTEEKKYHRRLAFLKLYY